MIYIKKMKKNEKIKMKAARCLDENKSVMLPHFFIGDFCVMPLAKGVTKTQRADPARIADLLSDLYKRTTNTYSEGIYSFSRRGRTKRTDQLPFYRYLRQEIDSLTSGTVIKPEFSRIEGMARIMWDRGYELYKDTCFLSYNFLHGDLHSGNIVCFLGQYRLIDWEYLRSGPKELEISFYLCWDYFRHDDCEMSIGSMMRELDVFCDKGLINPHERERILYCLIPMWMLLLVLYLNNGNLLFAEERRKVCEEIIPLYKERIFDIGVSQVHQHGA